ncbi:MAG: hypothetical protein AAFN59_12235 [Pseudomonadota bacterium]
MTSVPAGISLAADETLLWSGTPTRGFIGRGQTIWTVILFGLPALAWIAFALDPSQSPSTTLPALLSLILPVFAVRDWRRRQHTTYVLTSHRAILLIGESPARELRHGPQPAPEIEGNAVTFDGIPRVRFEALEDPETVLSLAMDAWRSVR